jgi:hypothetical protein
MSRWLALATLAGLSLVLPASALGQSPSSARLDGTFAMSGHVTIALNVKGERSGEKIIRAWTFASACPAGQCATVTLTRSLGSGKTNTLTLRLKSPGHYMGRGSLFAPLACQGHKFARGERVPFVITVRITGAAEVNGVRYASDIRATYTNRRRINRTRCVLPPSRESATYNGQLI